MIAIMASELYRLGTVRSWWLSLLGAAVLTTGVTFLGDAPWAVVLGMAVFGFGVVFGTQHYQHRTAVLVFLARPRRTVVLAGQTLVFAFGAGAFAAVTGVPMLASQPASYLMGVMAAPFLAIFAVANAAILRKPITILAAYGGWFFVVEVLLGRLELPGPFTAFINTTARSSPQMVIVSVFWAVVATGVAWWAINRDVAGE
jgi:hypothetical protein